MFSFQQRRPEVDQPHQEVQTALQVSEKNPLVLVQVLPIRLQYHKPGWTPGMLYLSQLQRTQWRLRRMILMMLNACRDAGKRSQRYVASILFVVQLVNKYSLSVARGIEFSFSLYGQTVFQAKQFSEISFLLAVIII